MLIEMNTTCGTEEEARRIARRAVEEHLCACAHVSPVQSFYWWDGKTQDDSEFRLSFKTVSDRYDDIVKLVKAEHSYDLPAIYSTPVLAGTSEYVDWVVKNSAG